MTDLGFNPRFQTPRSAYVHVPFCRHRCGYCNFTLVAKRDDLIDSYLRAIDTELSWLGSPTLVETLFCGGGTPTHLSSAELESLLRILDRWLPRANGAEFSVEANPLDITPERLRVLKSGGVNRISLGLQSFNTNKLALLERDHSPTEGDAAARLCLENFPFVSLDLIFGAPGETLDDWKVDLKTALQLEPQHVSLYGLTFERGTQFWSRRERGELSGVDEETERAMYELAINQLTNNGYEHYEVSNFARPGFRCRHNEVYWTGRSFLAFGPGAARYVDGRRETNHRSTTTYLNRIEQGQSPVAESEILSPLDSMKERLIFGLRRLEGIDLSQLERETGVAIDCELQRTIDRYVDLHLLSLVGTQLKLTRSGLLVSDSLWPEFLR